LEDKEGRSLDSDEESYNKEEDMSIQTGDQDLSLGDYNLEATEVLSGIFEGEHGQKYEEPANFLQALWNVAGPSVGTDLIRPNQDQTKRRQGRSRARIFLNQQPTHRFPDQRSRRRH
jgi:hypothetical protein